MLDYQLSPDTEAILLLWANLEKDFYNTAKPLNLRDYNALEVCLRENQMRPGDLLTPTGRNKLAEIEGDRFDSARIIALLHRDLMLRKALVKWSDREVWIVGRGDGEYPQSLKENLLHLAPPILYGIGRMELLSRGGLAVVGSRDADEEAIAYTQRVGAACAEEGVQIISGGARGVDINAMLGALEAGGTAVGVLPDSLTKAALSAKYRWGMAEGRLTLVSPWGVDVRFTTNRAMTRNKYIYALGDRALVVSSAVGKGGTWSGAVDALEKITKVPLFVRFGGNVPEGNRELWKKGAIAFPEEPWNKRLWQLLAQEVSIKEEEATFETLPEEIEEIVATLEEEIAEPQQKLAPVEEEIAEEGVLSEVSTSQPAAEHGPKDVYEAVLPFILRNLGEPLEDKVLAERLEVQVGQVRFWLKRAVEEGKVIKNKNPVTYVAIGS
ncbi:MAG: DNA-processing protein DprA [Cyanobacteriota bacterium]|nr:DNA-processing protein DprA [Cyanobacteriota bacterium]